MTVAYSLQVDFWNKHTLAEVIKGGNFNTAIFEILIFRNFSGGQSPKFCQNGENYDPILERRKMGLQHTVKIRDSAPPQIGPPADRPP